MRRAAERTASHTSLSNHVEESFALFGVETLIAPATSPLASKSGAAMLAMPASEFEWLITRCSEHSARQSSRGDLERALPRRDVGHTALA